MTDPLTRAEVPLVRVRYHFTDFRTAQLRATLPLDDVSLTEVLSGASDGSAKLSLASEVRARDPFTATQPRRSCLWAVRETLDPRTGLAAAQPVLWSGIVMSRKRNLLGSGMSLGFVSWESYLARRFVPDLSCQGEDVFTVARRILRAAIQQLPIPGRMPGQPSRTYPPLVWGYASPTEWEDAIAAGWRGRSGDPVRTTEPLIFAAIALRDRVSAGLDYNEDYSWTGNPQVVADYNDDLMRLTPPGLAWDNRTGLVTWLNDLISARAGVAILYHPLAPASPAPVLHDQVTADAWQALLAAGWRGRDDGTDNRIYPPLSLMAYVSPAIPGELYYPPSPFPTVSPHHYLLDTIAGPTAGHPVDREYKATDNTTALEAINELADSEGFDWRLTPTMLAPGDLGSFRLRLDLGYPRLGRIEPAEVRWSTDPADAADRWGVILAGDLDEDGSATANRVTAVGSGSGPTQLRATADSSQTVADEMGYGLPLYEGTAQATQTDRTQQQVDARARGALLAGLGSELTLSGITVRGDLPPYVTSYTVGDDATIRVGESVNGHPVEIVGQIIGRTIKPAGRTTTERVTLDVQGVVH